MARHRKPTTDNWPTRRELIALTQQQDELIGQLNLENRQLRALEQQAKMGWDESRRREAELRARLQEAQCTPRSHS